MELLKKYKDYVFVILSLAIYFLLAYTTKRTEFTKLAFFWVFLFVFFYLLIKSKAISTRFLIITAILARLVFFFSVPFLSQDFYRFIWDGRMLLEGFNPYLSLPETFIQEGNFPIKDAKELYSGMGKLNGSNYTNYPPLNEFCFFIGALFSNASIFGNIIVLRILIIFADLGIISTGILLLKKLNLNPKNIFWYALNPLVIIEMTGNLHFEPVMLFFFILGIYNLHEKRWILGAFWLACSISLKLIPILFLPLFLNWFLKNDFKKSTSKWLRLILFYGLVVSFSILSFFPFFDEVLIENYTNSVGLWFKKFEFNASFYYLFREIGYLFRGYNEIAIIGKITAVLTILVAFYISIFRKNKSTNQLLTSMLILICFYYFVSTTIHPWYIATPLLLSVFSKYRFVVVWSFTIILSYQAYANLPWKENFWLLFIEYSLMFGYLGFEIFSSYKKKKDLIIS